jgi:hypothetical protein
VTTRPIADADASTSDVELSALVSHRVQSQSSEVGFWRDPFGRLIILFGVVALVSTGIGISAGAAATPSVSASAVRSYVAQIERVRLPVNRLLNGADPILDAYHDHDITPAVASQEMGKLEEHFAHYLSQVNAINPSSATLRRLNTPYAHTYYYEDSYLSALASDLDEGDFDGLPETQNAQRLAIIVWRTHLELVASKAGVKLPADLQAAGRGEIAPSVSGS